LCDDAFDPRDRAANCLGNRTGANGWHNYWAKDLLGVPAQAIVADVDGDGVGEILVPTSDRYLNCLEAAARR